MKITNFAAFTLLLSFPLGSFGQGGPSPSYATVLEEGIPCYDAPPPSGKPIKILNIADVLPLASVTPLEERGPGEWVSLIVDMNGRGLNCFVSGRFITPFGPSEPAQAASTVVEHIMSLKEGSMEQVAALYSALFEQDTYTDTAWDTMVPEERDVLEWELLAYLEQDSGEDTDATGTVMGVAIDQNSGVTLPGATVLVLDTDYITYTDIDGRYQMELPAGPHDIQVTMPGYAEQVVTIEVMENQLLSMEIIFDSNVFSEEVVVRAASVESDSSTATAQMRQRLSAPVVQDNIGADEMSSNDDSDVADAMRRVTGVSVIDNHGQSLCVVWGSVTAI